MSDDYYPIEPNYYNYAAMESLEINIDYYLNEHEVNSIILCAFEINNEYIAIANERLFGYSNEVNKIQ
jgi:hypothetical protein